MYIIHSWKYTDLQFLKLITTGQLIKKKTSSTFCNMIHENLQLSRWRRPSWCVSGFSQRNVPSNLYQIPKLECFSSHLAVVVAQSIDARCSVKNKYVVGAAPTGDAPTASE